MKKLFSTILLLTLTFVIFADAKGDEIAKKMYNLPESDDSYSIATMILESKSGNKKSRKLEMYTKETSNGTNSFVKFIEPADVKGTTFLTIGYKEGDDEQRIYLPALGKVRRISSSNKDGKFMGSDIFYYDMEDRDFGDNTYKYIKDDNYNGKDCYVIESYPKDSDAPYSKQVLWISKADNFAYKIECYDKKSSKGLLKTIIMIEVKNFSGILMTTKMVVDNHKEGTKTALINGNVKINIGLKDNIFTVQNLTK